MMKSALSTGLFLFVAAAVLVSCDTCPDRQAEAPGAFDVVHKPYELNTGLVSRSISFENPTGAPGGGGKAASRLGAGRKGSPMRRVKPDSMFVLCDIEGSGTINHVWITTSRAPDNLRNLIIRAWWDGQEHPSIECPVGDFMGFAHGKVMPYDSAAHSLGENAGMNIWLPMPFASRARITMTNEGEAEVPLYYQIDYTLNHGHGADIGRLHCLFRRENPTVIGEDFTILPKRTNPGRFIGCVLGIRYEDKHWWGEGEIKFYMDGDTEFPTICGTGSEDYVCLSYGMQQTPFLYNGCSLEDEEKGFVSMYRWHLPDPIYWKEDCRVTIQQIGYDREVEGGLYERADDWSTATFWYEPVPSEPLPPLPSREERTKNIWVNE